ncbi:hypothetical protein RUND412_007115 [Rhizina undulata]
MSKPTPPILPIHDAPITIAANTPRTSDPAPHTHQYFPCPEKEPDHQYPSPLSICKTDKMRLRAKFLRIASQAIVGVLTVSALYFYYLGMGIFKERVNTAGDYTSGVQWTKTDIGDGGEEGYFPTLWGGKDDLAGRLGYTIVADIPKKWVPKEENVEGVKEKRLIVVGDVHGMYDELVKLLEKLTFNHKRDHLVLAGDLVSKGPHSLKVLDLARNYGASCVRGNHDDRVMLHYHEIQEKRKTKHGIKFSEAGFGPTDDAHESRDPDSDMDLDVEDDDNSDDEEYLAALEDDGLDEDGEEVGAEGKHRIKEERKLARSMTKEQAMWLDSCPLILRARHVRGLGEVAVVHAGLVEGVELKDQDPVALMNLRTVDKKLHVPSQGKKGVHWAKVWNKEEQLKPPAERLTVIYGHYAAKGLDIRPYTKGLDTNCVRGGKLTAFVISNANPDDELVHVHCQQYI